MWKPMLHECQQHPTQCPPACTMPKSPYMPVTLHQSSVLQQIIIRISRNLQAVFTQNKLVHSHASE